MNRKANWRISELANWPEAQTIRANSLTANRQSLRRSRLGFTLVELVAYLGLVVVILVAVTGFAWNIVSGKVKAEGVQTVEQNGRFAIERLTQLIHAGQSINVAGSTFGATPGRVNLVMRVVAVNPTVIDVAAGRLRLAQGASAPVFLTSDDVQVTDFTVLNRSSGRSQNVEVRLSIEHVNPSGQADGLATESWETAVELRDR